MKKTQSQTTSSASVVAITQSIYAFALWTPFPPPLRQDVNMGVSFSMWPRPSIEFGTIAGFSSSRGKSLPPYPEVIPGGPVLRGVPGYGVF